jgi:hypothetical protein
VTVYCLQKVCFNPYKSEKHFCLNDINFNVMPHLTENQTVHAIGMLQAELAHNIVARQCGVYHNTIQSLLMCIRHSGNTKDRHLHVAHKITT